jgi:hypothetical protein
MANTYTQIHLQCVMAVKYRQSIIGAEWKDKLEKYITGIVQNHEHKMLAIYAMHAVGTQPERHAMGTSLVNIARIVNK